MIDIKISVSNVDYEAALDTLLPVLLEHLSKKTENAFLSSILSKTKGVSSIAVSYTHLDVYKRQRSATRQSDI